MERMTDYVDDGATYRQGVHKATRELARSKPWRGTTAERLRKLRAWVDACAAAYGMEPVKVEHNGSAHGTSAASRVSDDGRRLELVGRLSVVTVLHLFHKARTIQAGGQVSHFKAMRWSISLFKRRFPISFIRCRIVGGMLLNESAAARELASNPG